tara:strand:+ start:1599 stop:1832 length:234 start_codon:yes stop_codon:yes gene_type:complete
MNKYGVNTERTDLSILEWLQHLQEELMDATVYIEKLKSEMVDMKGMEWRKEIHGPIDFDDKQKTIQEHEMSWGEEYE